MHKSGIDIIQITLPETYPIRRAVLYPEGPDHKIHIPNDDEGIHFGALSDQGSQFNQEAEGDAFEEKGSRREIIGTISLFRETLPVHLTSFIPPSPQVQSTRSLRFRKFACLNQHQGRGIGTKMLQHVVDFARDHSELGPGSLIWCDARRSTVDWYLKRGMKVLGSPFFKGDIEYVVMVIYI